MGRVRIRSGVRGAATLLALVLVPVGVVEGQEVRMVDPGDRVRVSAEGASGEFLVSGMRSDRLVVRSDSLPEPVSIPTRSVYEIQVLEGRRSHFVGALQGGVGGALAGGILSAHCGLPHVTCRVANPVQRVLIGAGVGAVVGLLTRGGQELWEEIRLPGQPYRVPPGGGSRDALAADERESGPDFVARADLRELVDQGEDLYTLVQRIRPNWLRTRFLGGRREDADVYVDGIEMGDPGVLRGYSVRDVRSLEFVDPTDTSSPFNSLGGVISVRTGG